MTNYDFLALSPYEFEGLTRDLLQLHYGVHLESFGLGKDNGIDLRYSKGEQFIVQCKRYQDFESLMKTLKKETDSVKRLSPKRYILVTSVSLLPERKQKIVSLFEPFITSTEDVMGKEDLNNLIQQFPKVEKDHFKLWLSSTNILHTILNSQIVNQSKFVLDEIKEKVKVYVQNTSFYEAHQILQEHRYIIISGIPGIGKTTLAEILVYDALANGFEELVYLSDSIDQGFTMYEEAKSQVFLFDDFLGSNFLDNKLGTNEEKQILRFIKKIQSAKNKLLIFTTREYILNQAKIKFEQFDKTEFVKCILDLSKYTTLVKAKILYNHLFFNNIPYPFVEEVINRNYLLKIIQHPNYNPRIIEYLANVKLWQKYDVKSFPEVLLKTFESPFQVWEHAFEGQITSNAKMVLYGLFVCGSEVRMSQLYKQVKMLNTSSGNASGLLTFADFKSALKELDNSFIQTSRTNEGDFLIKFHNPSIKDFLLDYIDASEEIKGELIQSFLFLKPALQIFTYKKQKFLQVKTLSLSSSLSIQLKHRLMSDFEELSFSPELYQYSSPSADDYTVQKLSVIQRQIELEPTDSLHDFMFKKFQPILYSEDIGNRGVGAYTEQLIEYYGESETVDIKRILLDIVIPAIWNEEDFTVLSDIEECFPEQFQQFKDEHFDEYQDIFSGVISELSDVGSKDKDELKKNLESLQEIERYYDVDTYFKRSKVEEAIEKIERQEENESIEDYYDGPYYSKYYREDYNNDRLDNNSSKYVRPQSERVYTEQENVENIFPSLQS